MSKAAELAALIGSQTALSNRNLIINGAMQVAQRGTSFSYAHDGTTAAYNLDRFSLAIRGSGYSDEFDCTITQVSDAPAGFSNSLKLTTGTAESAVGADEYYNLYQAVEAQNLQLLNYGTSSAKTTTLSFYVKSSITGTFGCSLYQGDDNRIINRTYTINSANTWERKTISIAADPTGVIDNDNTGGLWIYWSFGQGSDFDGGTTATDWTGYTTTNFFDSSSTDSVVTTAGATWQITGVQFEVGDVATPFEHRSIGDELARCMRYYYRVDEGNTTGQIALGIQQDSDDTIAIFHLPQPLRATPTISFDKLRIHHNNGAEEGNFSCNNIYLNQSMLGLNLDTTNSPFSTDEGISISVNSNGYLEIISEL